MYVEYVLHTKIVPSSSQRGEAPIGLSDRRNDSSDGGGKASPILEKLEIYGDGPPDSAIQFPRRFVPYFASMLIEAFSHVQFVPLTPK